MTYNAAALDVAIVGVHTGISIQKASAIFGVPQTMLQAKISGKTPEEMRKGSKPYRRKDQRLATANIPDWIRARLKEMV